MIMPAQGHPTEDEIVALERSYWNALCKKDGATTARLSAEQALVTGKQGLMAVSRQAMKTMTEEGKWTLNSYQFDDVKFLSPAPDVAILAYAVTQNVTMNGNTLNQRAANSSTWIRGPEGWQCCAHSESFLE
jgi:ketosteroid isomerase-like protein